MNLKHRIFESIRVSKLGFLTIGLGILVSMSQLMSGLNHFCCNSKNKPKGFKVLESYQKKLTPGQPNLPVAHEYFFKILVQHNDLRFDSLWVNKVKLATHVARTKAAVSDNPVQFGKGDTITVRASHLQKNDEAKMAAFPIKADAEAVLSYYYKNKRKYLAIKSIQKNMQ
ncbi:MAG: hypothetical protein IPM48_04350 [Saprospiraceae bacterium]|nr:hypothetical protein [Saprospiraceae bacterium]